MARRARRQTRRYLSKEELIELRENVLRLHAQGYTQRQIAEKLDTKLPTVHRELHKAIGSWHRDPLNSPEAVRATVAEGFRGLGGYLFREIDRQASEGNWVREFDGQGNLLREQRKGGLDPRLAAELGRTSERLGRLMGIVDGPSVEGGGSAGVVVMLPGPAGPNNFEKIAAQMEPPASAPALPAGGPEAIHSDPPAVDVAAEPA